MAIFVSTKDPRGLLEDLFTRVQLGARDPGAPGGIRTWVLDERGDLRCPGEVAQASFHPVVTSSGLAFLLSLAKGAGLTRADYALLHGRLVGTLLAEEWALLEDVELTIGPTEHEPVVLQEG